MVLNDLKSIGHTIRLGLAKQLRVRLKNVATHVTKFSDSSNSSPRSAKSISNKSSPKSAKRTTNATTGRPYMVRGSIPGAKGNGWQNNSYLSAAIK